MRYKLLFYSKLTAYYGRIHAARIVARPAPLFHSFRYNGFRFKAMSHGGVPGRYTAIMPIDVAIGIVVRDGNILIARRPDDGPLAGYWEFPGGKCQPGESPNDCLLREMREETSLTVEIITPMLPLEYAYVYGQVRLHPFLCQIVAGQAKALAAAEIRWVALAELTEYRMPPANATIIRWLAENIGRNS